MYGHRGQSFNAIEGVGVTQVNILSLEMTFDLPVLRNKLQIALCLIYQFI